MCRREFLISFNMKLIPFRYKGHKSSEYKLDACLTNDDAHVVSGSEDGKIYFWDLVEVLHVLAQ